ncbi:MAG: zinc ribbon domain-containing protein [Anaerolineae bacterium]|nr:zinc ribbon domain-containing protein [Anaerolineae bacterium]
MPIYEYRCRQCHRRFSIFWRTFAAVDETHINCKHCGSQNVRRLVSKVRVLRSEDSVMEDMADPSTWGDIDENDPKSMGRFMRRMANELGEEAGELGPEFDEVIDRLEAGQDPEQIEQDMPDLAGNIGDTGGMDTLGPD